MPHNWAGLSKAFPVAFIFALSFSAIAATNSAGFAFAQSFETIIIRADGSIDPRTAPITRNGNEYILTENIIANIQVEKANIIIDGAGYTIRGNGFGKGIEIANPYNTTIRKINDITVKNFNIEDFEIGIAVFGYYWEGNTINGIVIAENNVTNNDVGIRLSSYSRYSNNTIIGNRITANNVGISIEMGAEETTSKMDGNTITENQIANNKVGAYFVWMFDIGHESSPLQMYNTIVNNNFVNNSQNIVNGNLMFTPEVANIWDNATVGVGNYWSDYNGTDNNADGIGDTPYIIDANNIDRYPLIVPYQGTIRPQSSEPFPTTLVAVASGTAVVAVGAGLIVYFRRIKKKP